MKVLIIVVSALVLLFAIMMDYRKHKCQDGFKGYLKNYNSYNLMGMFLLIIGFIVQGIEGTIMSIVASVLFIFSIFYNVSYIKHKKYYSQNISKIVD